jgi:hypothetical protein
VYRPVAQGISTGIGENAATSTCRPTLHVHASAPQPLKWWGSGTDSLLLSTCAGNIPYGAQELGYITPTQHDMLYGRQRPSCYRVDGALTPTRNKPSFTPRRSGGKDERASHMNVELCACARAMDSSRGDYRETLLQTLSGCRVQYSVSLGPRFTPVSVRSTTPASRHRPVWENSDGHSPLVWTD